MGPPSCAVSAVVPASVALIVSIAPIVSIASPTAGVSPKLESGEDPSVEVRRREPEHASAKVQMRYGRFFLVIAANDSPNVASLAHAWLGPVTTGTIRLRAVAQPKPRLARDCRDDGLS